MDQTTRGIILRTHRFSETSLIVRWLTPDLGRVATLARGALRPKSAFRGRLDLYYLAQIAFTSSRRSTLHSLKEISLLETFEGLRHTYTALENAAYATRLVEKITETDTPLPGIFELLEAFLRLACHPPTSHLHVAEFELRLLEWSGQAPDLDTCDLSLGARAVCRQLLCASPSLRSRLRTTPDQIREIHRFLGNHLAGEFDIPPTWRPAAQPLADPERDVRT